MQLISTLLNSPVTSITLALALYQLGMFIKGKIRFPLANPLLLAQVLLLVLILYTPMEAEAFLSNTAIFSVLLVPATAALALVIYRNLKTLREYALPIFAGCFVGSLVSFVGTIALSRLLGLDEIIVMSLAPKSVTSPIALELAAMQNGIAGVVALGVMVTGLSGMIIGPWLMEKLRITDPVEQGVAMGTTAHIVGTVRAMEMGQLQGAMSGLSISITGLFTVILFWFL